MGRKDKKHEINTRSSTYQRTPTHESTSIEDDEFEFQISSPNSTKDLSKLLKKLQDLESGETIVKIVNKLNSAIEFLSGQVNNLKRANLQLKSNYDELAVINTNLSSRVAKAESKLIEVETNAAKLDQYGRRNNLQIDGIPDDVGDDILEEKVCQILEEIQVPIKRHEIEACHRLPSKRGEKGPKKTVLRLVNRRKCEQAVRNAKKLNEKEIQQKLKVGRVFVSENLCPYYRKLAYMCRCLRRAGKIEHVSSANGSIRILIQPGDAKRVNIVHDSDLTRRFPDFSFE